MPPHTHCVLAPPFNGDVLAKPKQTATPAVPPAAVDEGNTLVERLDVTAEVAEGLPGHAPRAAVTLVAHFVNTSTVPVEGRFACPVDTQAAVGAVSLKVGERTTQAHAVSQDTADTTFDDAVAGGKRSLHVDGASLVSEGVLRLSVGLLPPGERVAATVTYLTDLALDHVDEAGGYVHRLVVPLVGDAAVPARTGSGAGASADVYDVSARVYACAGSAALLSSPTHNMAFAADSSTLFTPDRDLVVHCTVAHAAGGSASVAVSSDAAVPAAYRHAFALPVDVPGCVRAGGGKVAVLLDCGPEVSAAAVLDEGKRFCSAMVRALPEGTSVAVASLGLGDMPPLRVLKDGGVREEVLGKVSRMKAAGGGRLSAARLASALRGVVQTHGADTEVVVVMPGCTESSRGELQAAVSASELTVHAVSVGHAAGRGLVEAVAQAGGGLFTHVALQEKVRRKADALVEGMQKALPAAASRCVTTSTPGVRLCVDGPLSGKRDNVVRGFAAEGVETVTLACAGLDWSHTFTLPPPRAAVLLRELHACVAAAALRTATPEDTHLIATAFDMPSAHTSLVATDTAVYTGSVAGFSTRSVEAPAAAAMRAPKAVGARVPSAQSDTRAQGKRSKSAEMRGSLQMLLSCMQIRSAVDPVVDPVDPVVSQDGWFFRRDPQSQNLEPQEQHQQNQSHAPPRNAQDTTLPQLAQARAASGARLGSAQPDPGENHRTQRSRSTLSSQLPLSSLAAGLVQSVAGHEATVPYVQDPRTQHARQSRSQPSVLQCSTSLLSVSAMQAQAMPQDMTRVPVQSDTQVCLLRVHTPPHKTQIPLSVDQQPQADEFNQRGTHQHQTRDQLQHQIREQLQQNQPKTDQQTQQTRFTQLDPQDQLQQQIRSQFQQLDPDPQQQTQQTRFTQLDPQDQLQQQQIRSQFQQLDPDPQHQLQQQIRDQVQQLRTKTDQQTQQTRFTQLDPQDQLQQQQIRSQFQQLDPDPQQQTQQTRFTQLDPQDQLQQQSRDQVQQLRTKTDQQTQQTRFTQLDPQDQLQQQQIRSQFQQLDPDPQHQLQQQIRDQVQQLRTKTDQQTQQTRFTQLDPQDQLQQQQIRSQFQQLDPDPQQQTQQTRFTQLDPQDQLQQQIRDQVQQLRTKTDQQTQQTRFTQLDPQDQLQQQQIRSQFQQLDPDPQQQTQQTRFTQLDPQDQLQQQQIRSQFQQLDPDPQHQLQQQIRDQVQQLRTKTDQQTQQTRFTQLDPQDQLQQQQIRSQFQQLDPDPQHQLQQQIRDQVQQLRTKTDQQTQQTRFTQLDPQDQLQQQQIRSQFQQLDPDPQQQTQQTRFTQLDPQDQLQQQIRDQVQQALALQRLAASPTDAESYYALAQLLAKGQCVTLQTGEVMDRVQLLKRAIALAPEDAKLYRALGESIDGDSTVLESGVVCTKAALLAM